MTSTVIQSWRKELRLWLLQLYALEYKNFMQSFRGWPTTLLRMSFPVLIILVIGIVQLSLNDGGVVIQPSHPIETLHPGMGELLYYPAQNSSATAVMTHVAEKHGFSMGTLHDDAVCQGGTLCGLDSYGEVTLKHIVRMREEKYPHHRPLAGIVAFGYHHESSAAFTPRVPAYVIAYNNTKLRPSPFKSSQKALRDHRLSIKKAVDEALLHEWAGIAQPDLAVRTMELPSAESASENPERFLSLSIHVSLYVGLFFLLVPVHFGVNQERNSKVLQSMMGMGLRDSVYWISTLLFNMVLSSIVSIVVIAIGAATHQSFFLHSDPWAMFLVLFCISYALTAMFLFFSTFVRSPRATNIWAFLTLCVGLLFVAVFIPFSTVQPAGGFFMVAFGGKWFQIFQPVCIGLLTQHINHLTMPVLDDNGQWHHASRFTLASLYRQPEVFGSASLDDKLPTMNETLLYLFMVSTFLVLVAWYMDQVLPGGSHGITRPLYFPVSPAYWGFTKHSLAVDVAKHNAQRMASVLPDTDRDIYREYQNTIDQVHREDSDDRVPLKIVKLGKTYTKMCRGGNRALDSITLSANQGTVLAMLGHNGAGKTTAVDCLTGCLTPTSGDALIYGYSVVNELSAVQSMMGICPQHDILWNDVTAFEHIWIFSLIKGIYDNLKDSIRERLEFVDLDAVGKHKVRTFSGGMKRRLSVAISTIGDPSIIFLDEPTSGMDPVTRRHVWRLVQRLKEERMVVLTTHSMEEAEFLGDKIAILALGRLRAVGSPLHLKSRYGAGYALSLSTSDSSDTVAQVKQRVRQLHPKAKLQEENGNKLQFAIPLHYSNHAARVLGYIEDEYTSGEGVIEDWGISHTTLEQVFIRITHGERSLEDENDDINKEQLNISIEDAEEPIGFVEIDDNTTLMDLREQVRQDIDHVPSEFHFLSHSIPLSRKQEATKLAVHFTPLIFVRPVSLDTQEDHTESIEEMKRQIHSLEQKLITSENEKSQLKARVRQLEAMLEKNNSES
eukprot:gb/GECH01012358.1/.p1 GENE.gb/GECH01012358.1/~~gb/GECH01012358.1/.p1  ORF type:complete len:1006 (+),score=219.67 gb/GECH01012358.1/:1-3018(+)